MAKGLPVENRKLGTLAQYFGYDNQQAHRSITDAEVCAYIFAKMAQTMDEGHFGAKRVKGARRRGEGSSAKRLSR